MEPENKRDSRLLIGLISLLFVFVLAFLWLVGGLGLVLMVCGALTGGTTKRHPVRYIAFGILAVGVCIFFKLW